MKHFASLVLISSLCGCVGANSPPPAVSQAASIEYQLPITTAKLTMDLVLHDCTSDGPLAVPKITMTPVANPNFAPEQRFRIYGANLASFSKNRNLQVELYPNGAVKSINGGVADRTGAIIANVLKIGAGLIGIVGAPPPPAQAGAIVCNDETKATLRQVAALQTRIAGLKSQLAGASPSEAESIRLAVDALAAEVARLRTGPLQLTLERELFFRKGNPDPANPTADTPGGVVHWGAAEVAKWLVVPAGTANPYFAVGWCVRPSRVHYDSNAPRCTAQLAEANETLEQNAGGTQYVAKPGCYDADPLLSCSKTLVFREPIDATLVVVSQGRGLKNFPRDKKLAQQDLAISQWGTIAELPLTTGLGGSFTMAAGFNEFGKRTSFTWKSEARGESITGAASSIVDSAGLLQKALTTDLEEQQATITELETRQKLNKLEKCREIIEAGGFTCPAT